ncbi:MAG: hypothetical protein JRN09_07270 [Nitrososphaerota archaeon]|nr:hypothetical protein [Nitrososphaerota archaeon]
MPPKLEVSEETRAGLNRYASAMKQRLGRRVTFDEVIRELLEAARESPQAVNVERRRGWRKGKWKG